MDNRKKIIDNIINELNGRSGFDDWWCNIDEDTQEEIEQTLVNTLPIQGVSQQRELLENFADWMDKNVNFDGIRQEEIESYITEKIL